MNSSYLISFDQLSNALLTIQALGSPSGMHGWLTGYLAAGGRLNDKDWQKEACVLVDVSEPLPKDFCSLMTLFYGWVLQRLHHEDMSFELFLPDDDETDTSVRVMALSHWCQGFLEGFGVSYTTSKKVPKEIQQILSELDAFSQARCEKNDAQDETHLFNIVEHVRLSALHVFFTCNQRVSQPKKKETHRVVNNE
jgi:uncharacterized protein YgfB (UPF0149 family)